MFVLAPSKLMNSSCTLLLPVRILAVYKARAQELALMHVLVCGVYPEGWIACSTGDGTPCEADPWRTSEL